jgi:hypothetical protein
VAGRSMPTTPTTQAGTCSTAAMGNGATRTNGR